MLIGSTWATALQSVLANVSLLGGGEHAQLGFLLPLNMHCLF